MAKKSKKNEQQQEKESNRFFTNKTTAGDYFRYAVIDPKRNYLHVERDWVFYHYKEKFIDFYFSEYKNLECSEEKPASVFIKVAKDEPNNPVALTEKEIDELKTTGMFDEVYVDVWFYQLAINRTIKRFLNDWILRNYCTPQQAACLITGADPDKYIQNETINHPEAEELFKIIEHWATSAEQKNLLFYVYESHIKGLSYNQLLNNLVGEHVRQQYKTDIFKRDNLKKYPLFLLGYERYYLSTKEVFDEKKDASETGKYLKVKSTDKDNIEKISEIIKPKIYFLEPNQNPNDVEKPKNTTLLAPALNIDIYFRKECKEFAEENNLKEFIPAVVYANVYFVNEIGWMEKLSWEDLYKVIEYKQTPIGGSEISIDDIYIKKSDYDDWVPGNKNPIQNPAKDAEKFCVTCQTSTSKLSYFKLIHGLIKQGYRRRLDEKGLAKELEEDCQKTGVTLCDDTIQNILDQIKTNLKASLED